MTKGPVFGIGFLGIVVGMVLGLLILRAGLLPSMISGSPESSDSGSVTQDKTPFSPQTSGDQIITSVLWGGIHQSQPDVKITIDTQDPAMSFWNIRRQGADLSKPYPVYDSLMDHFVEYLAAMDLSLADKDQWTAGEPDGEGIVVFQSPQSSIRFGLYHDVILDGRIAIDDLVAIPSWVPASLNIRK